MTTEDEEIIARVVAGEHRAFQLLVDRHSPKAMTLAMRMLKNREDAEEALQDAFVRAFRGLERFERKARFATWFYRILFNVCYSAAQKKGDLLEQTQERAALPEDLSSPEPARPDHLCESRELEEMVGREIEALPPVYGGVFTLFFLQEMSYEEIAMVTGVPVNTVKTRLFRARAMLRDAVAARLADAPGNGSPCIGVVGTERS